MSEEKGKKLSAAEKAVSRAVEEQTKELRDQLAAFGRRVNELEATLRGISATALRVAGEQGQAATVPAAPRPPLPPVAEPPIPEGPKVDLNPGDTMGVGRWA